MVDGIGRRQLLLGTAAAMAAIAPRLALAEATLPPVSAAGIKSFVPYPAIEAFSSALVGDGVTDDSVALKAAHDAAYAAGVREVSCSKQYYAPTAYNLGNVIFWGEGALLSTYRKKIIPPSARQMAWMAPRIIPAIHLRRFAKALNPTVVIWSDSTGTESANHISIAEMLWTMIQRAILRDNPGRTFTMVNRAIGGTDYTQFNATGTALQGAGVTLPSWFTVPASAWTGFISNQNPDLVIVDFGTNNPSAATLTAINNLVAFLVGLTKVPDIIFVTNNPRSTQADSGSSEVSALDLRDLAAGSTRSYAEFNGYGLIDCHRYGCILRDGFDPCTQVMTQNIASQSFALPATLPTTQHDFDLTFTIDNSAGVAFGSAQAIDIALSAVGGNVLRVKQSGSNYQIQGFAGGGGVWKSATTSSIAVPSGICTIQVSVRDSFIVVYFESQVVFEGQLERGGGPFAPTVAYSVGSGATAIVVGPYVTSAPQLCQPSLTDPDMYGTGSSLSGGNGINHPASGAYEAIHAQAIDQTNWSLLAAGRAVQAITAASAINPDASLVQLTGPSSGTFAITLAAPRVQDKGNTLAIEMTATTSINSVTLALTNVSGGTAATTCTWNAAGQRLILVAIGSTWEVVKQDGVTLS